MSSKLNHVSPQERYFLKKKLEEISQCKGRATELISLYVPPNRQISDVIAYLRNEYSQSSNIKSRVTRKNVMWAIESLINKVKTYKQPPPNGVVFFVGNKAVSNDATEEVSYIIEPIEPINIYMYKCDSFFYTEPLESMVVESEVYGLVVLDRKEATLGFLKGSRIIPIKNEQSLVPSKHGQGGQSQPRFERWIEHAAHEFSVKVATMCENAFLPVKSELKGIILGGPGPTKDFFYSENFLHYELQKLVILPLIDVGYTDEYGLKELVNKASSTIENLQITKQRKLVERFLLEIKKGNNLIVYGVQEVISKLSKGIVDVVLLSEDVRGIIVYYKCPVCNYSENAIYNKDDVKGKKCPKCGADMDIQSKNDVGEEIYKLAEQYNTKVELISTGFDEGELFYKTFNGIGAILRYYQNENG